MPIFLVLLQIVLKDANCFIVINFYPPLLLPSFAKVICHYYSYHSLTIYKEKIVEKKVTICYNSNMKQNSKEKNHLYILEKYIFLKSQKENLFSLEHIYIPCIFPHTFEVHLDFQFFQTPFKTPRHQKKISFPNSFMTNIKKRV
jgi:hypothetical protein